MDILAKRVGFESAEYFRTFCSLRDSVQIVSGQLLNVNPPMPLDVLNRSSYTNSKKQSIGRQISSVKPLLRFPVPMEDNVDQIMMDRVIAISLAEEDASAIEERQWRNREEQPLPNLPLLQTPSSSSYRPVITCDLCEEPKPPSGFFFDMVGCNHLLCNSCISDHSSSFGSSSLGLSSSFCSCLPCPLSKCTGFYSTTGKAAGFSPSLPLSPDLIGETLPIPSQSSSSSSISSQSVITCDFCEVPKSPSDCFLDMVDCNHIFCLTCIFVHHSSLSTSSSSMPCPFPACKRGSYIPPFRQQPTPNPDMYCTICMESKPPNECFLETRGCAHVFCSDCIAHYISSKLEENITVIPCPDTTCKLGFLDPESCRQILPMDVFDKWGAALCESSIVGPMKFYCPYKNCSALVINGGEEEEIVESICPHCSRSFCAKCKVPWHNNLSCEDYQKLGESEEERKDHLKLKEIADQRKWKRCPKCGFYVERVEGCVFIKCRCQHCFCYICLAKMDPGSHHCNKCNLTWDRR